MHMHQQMDTIECVTRDLPKKKKAPEDDIDDDELSKKSIRRRVG